MHTGIVVMGLFAITGVVLDFLPYLGRQIALPCSRAAAGLAAAAAGAATLVLSLFLHHFFEGFRVHMALAQKFVLCCLLHSSAPLPPANHLRLGKQ